MKIDWKRKLTSRKLWVSVASLIGNILIAAGASDHTITQVTAIVMAGASAIAYVIGEGLTDAANTGNRVSEDTGKNQIEFYTDQEENENE